MIRDAGALEAIYRIPFDGYARHDITWGPFFARISACIAVLATMLVSGVLLGTPPQRQLQK